MDAVDRTWRADPRVNLPVHTLNSWKTFRLITLRNWTSQSQWQSDAQSLTTWSAAELHSVKIVAMLFMNYDQRDSMVFHMAFNMPESTQNSVRISTTSWLSVLTGLGGIILESAQKFGSRDFPASTGEFNSGERCNLQRVSSVICKLQFLTN